jgi:hypothetical protein
MGPYLEEPKEKKVTRLYFVQFGPKTRRTIAPSELLRPEVSKISKANGIDIISFKERQTVCGGIGPFDPGEGCALEADGYSVVVVSGLSKTGRNVLGVFRLSRDTLICRSAVEEGVYPTTDVEFRTMFDDIVSWLHTQDVHPSQAALLGLFTVRPDDFIHCPDTDNEDHALYNRNLPRVLAEQYPDVRALVDVRGKPGLNLPALIRFEARRLEFSSVKVHKHLPSPAEFPRPSLVLVYRPN